MTGAVVAMPAARCSGPDGPRFVYSVEGARVTFAKPASPADLEAAAEVVRAGRRALFEMISRQVELEMEEPPIVPGDGQSRL